MAHPYINRALYDAIVRFETDEAAQEAYYRIMDSTLQREGRTITVRTQILRVYAMLFCDDLGLEPGRPAPAGTARFPAVTAGSARERPMGQSVAPGPLILLSV